MQNASTYFHIVHAVHMLIVDTILPPFDRLLFGAQSIGAGNCLLYSGVRCSDRPIISLGLVLFFFLVMLLTVGGGTRVSPRPGVYIAVRPRDES